MPDGVTFPFDPPGRSHRSCARREDEVSLLLDVVGALDEGQPAIAACLREHGVASREVALMFDAPFGVDGPALFELGDLRALLFTPSMTQSAMRVSDPSELLLDYTRVMMGFLLLHPAPRCIEMIGLGGGSLAKYCYRHLPDADITVVEIDPRVIALRDRFQIPRDDGRFRVVQADGADFVRDDRSYPDVILVDGFSRHGQARRLDDSEFYRNCRQRLGDDGVLVVNLCSNILARRIAKNRLRQTFGNRIAVVPIKGEQNRIVFSSKSCSVPDAGQLQRVAAALDMHQIDFPRLATQMAERFSSTGIP
ncbi:fused MFS/spermidine synthase [Sphingomonas koreensis]